MDIMTIFDLLLLVVGVYMVIASFRMKKTGVISTVLVTEEESGSCADKEGFIRDMYWREALLGAVMVLLGGLGFLNERVIAIAAWSVVEMLVFLSAFLWFQWGLNRARQRYF